MMSGYSASTWLWDFSKYHKSGVKISVVGKIVMEGERMAKKGCKECEIHDMIEDIKKSRDMMPDLIGSKIKHRDWFSGAVCMIQYAQDALINELEKLQSEGDN